MRDESVFGGGAARARTRPLTAPLRPARVVAVALLAAAVAAALVDRSTIAAQADAVVVLSAVLDMPVASWAVRHATEEPRVDEVVVAGVPTTLVRPGGSGPWPAVTFVNGATPRGRHHPEVEALARGFARAGYLVLVPEPPGLADGEITQETLEAAVAVAAHAASRPDARDGRVGLVGVSVGASLALVAAGDASLAGRVSVVAGIAPYTDLRNVLRLATVGAYEDDGKLIAYETRNYLSLVAARSLVASLPTARGRARLLALLPETGGVGEDPPDPLAALRTVERASLGRAARAVVALLANRDARRFDALYAALPPRIRAANAALSPLTAAERLDAPVELASAPRDKYFPVAESRELAAVAADVRVSVTTTLAHAIPEPSPGALADLVRFDAFVVRSLEHSAAGD